VEYRAKFSNIAGYPEKHIASIASDCANASRFDEELKENACSRPNVSGN
jgi:hypothetical protein